MEGMVRIVIPLAGSSLGLPGGALLLRVAWMERRDFRTKRTEHSVSLGNSSVVNFLISGLLSLVNNAQFDLNFLRVIGLRFKACRSEWEIVHQN